MSAPLRFLGALLLLWAGGRTAMLLPGAKQAMAPAPAPVRALLGIDAPRAPEPPAPTLPYAALAPPAAMSFAIPSPPSAAVPALTDAPLLTASLAPIRQRPEAALLLAAHLAAPRRVDLVQHEPSPVAPAARAAGPRWTGDAYLFARDGGGTGLAPGAQLGGGQMFARVSRTLGPGGLAATVRASRALAGRGAEAAAGVAWRPDPGLPLGITMERRAALDEAGRHAWAAFVAGGADAVSIGRRGRLDAYAQAGVVGARARDGFVDGAARIGRAAGPATLGGGMWGAAQPGAARLDIGPQAAVRLRLGDVAATAALDWRFRVAGRATPGDGVALTLAAGF